MEYLVTGGAGFIGSNMVRRLVEDGKAVRVLDNLATGRLGNISDLMEKIEFVDGDIRDTETVERAVSGVRYVLHFAALPSVARSVEDPLTSNQVNVCGTLKLLLASRDAGVERFVFSSSSSVYGDAKVLPKMETMTPSPLSPYAVQKLTGEHYCGIFCSLYGLKTYALRYFNVFGPRQNPKSQYSAVIPAFIDALSNGRVPVIDGDGNQTRDFTFVEDVVNANLCCCTASEDAAGQVFNISCGNRISINDLAALLVKMIKTSVVPVYGKPRSGDVRDSQGDSSKARKMLGWQSSVGFQDGLMRTVEFFLSGAVQARQ
jgi:nucleoside-diphosphate-sugar epimerase